MIEGTHSHGWPCRGTRQPTGALLGAGWRPDPLAAVTDELRAWFDADPASAGRQRLERLQETYPGCYPDGLVRTVQRRLKIWRGVMAHALVLGRAGSTSSGVLPGRTEQTP